jgi:hypothetical protein
VTINTPNTGIVRLRGLENTVYPPGAVRRIAPRCISGLSDKMCVGPPGSSLGSRAGLGTSLNSERNKIYAAPSVCRRKPSFSGASRGERSGAPRLGGKFC